MRLPNLFKYAFVFSLFLCTEGTLAQVYPYEEITIEDGLSQGMIFDIIQTEDGFLWFGTKDGLNRYDGNQIKIFANDPFNPNSISGNTITALYEDSKNRLWVGTQNNGLNLYNPSSYEFIQFKHSANKTNSPSSNAILEISEDPSGAIWILYKNLTLDKFKLNTDPFKQNDSPIQANWIRTNIVLPTNTTPNCTFHQTKDEKLLIEFDDGIHEIDWMKATSKPLSINTDNKSFTGIKSILEDSQGSIWIGEDNNIQIFEENNFFEIPFKEKDDFIIQIIEDNSGNIWIRGAYSLWKVAKNESLNHPLYLKKILSFDKNTSIMFADRCGTIWVGMSGYGVVKFNPKVLQFQNYISDKSVWSVYLDKTERIWIKNKSFYFLLNTQTNSLDTPPIFNIEEFEQRGFIQDNNLNYWVATTKEGSELETIIKQYSSNFQFISETLIKAPVNLNVRMLEYIDGSILIGLKQGLIAKINPNTGLSEIYSFAHLFPSFESELEIVCIESDNRGTIWIGTRHGLVKAIPQGNSFQFESFKNNPKDSFSLAANEILSIYITPEKQDYIWIGTQGGGVGLFDCLNNKFLFFDINDGLPSNVVYGILPDKNGNLWLSSNRGLTKANFKYTSNKVQAIFKNYGTSDGLPNLEFNTSAYDASNAGELFFGGVYGLTRFNPAELTLNERSPNIFITDIKVNNNVLNINDSTGILTTSPEYTKFIELRWNQNLLDIHFSALDYTAPSYNLYKYKMSGVDPDWVIQSNKNIVSYSHLSPGDYIFEVWGSNSDGLFSSKPARLNIKILTPWWKSWWAYAIYSLFFFGAIWSIYLFKINEIKLENQLQFEKKEADRLADLDKVKSQFFSNVTHEFRTPLTLIIEPLRQVLKKINDPELKNKLHLVINNSNKLLLMVNQLLDLSKVESKMMALNLRKTNIEELATSNIKLFIPHAENQEIELSLKFNDEIHTAFLDPDIVEKVISNLLSNALKFTPPGGKVHLTVSKKNNQLFISVTDTGIGIPKEKLSAIFDRFVQVDENKSQISGTGIGLSLVKELTELHGGQVSVESETGKGSKFKVSFPLDLKPIIKEPIEASTLPFHSIANTEAENNVPNPIPSLPKTEVLGTAQILLIEDNDELRSFIRQSIEDNYQVIESRNGADGINKAIESVPDLIISDLMMPEKDGFEVCQAVKNNDLTSHIPIILLTAKSNMESKLQGLRTGADDYLTKPFHTEELLTRIDNLIEQRKLLREKYAQHNSGSDGQPTEQLSKYQDEFVNRFVNIVTKEFDDEDLTVEKISANLFVSRSQLFRKIKAVTDQSPNEFLRNYRLDQGMKLLKTKNKNVSEVATMVGFSDEKYFSKRFKERFGYSPGQVN